MSSNPSQPALQSEQPPNPNDLDSREEAAQQDAPHVFDDDDEMQLSDTPANPAEQGDASAAKPDQSLPAPPHSPDKSLESPTHPQPEPDSMDDQSLGEPPQDDDLFAKLAASPSSVAGLVTEWLARVQVNGPASVADVLSLVVRLARPFGCPPLDLVTPQMVISNDPSSAVNDVAHVLRADLPGPIPATGKDPVSRKLRRAYEDFWRRLAAESTQVVLFDTDCFDTLISWLETMAVARSRALRTAACLAAYRLVDGFIDFGGRLRKQLSSMQRQLATEKRRCGVAPDQVRGKGRGKGASRIAGSKALSQKGKDLAKKVDDMTANNSELVELSNKVFDSILVLKYRDVSPDIRTISVSALGSWIIAYPDHFLDDKHTKYIGWLLSDKDPVVRRTTLEVLWRMLRKKEFYPSLEMFLQRFCDRILEMSRDKDDAVAVVAIRLLTTLTGYELLDEKSCQSISDIALQEAQTDIRRAAGEFLSKLIRAESGQEEAQALDDRRSQGKPKTTSKKRKKPSRDVHNAGLAEIPPVQSSRAHILELLFAISRGNADSRSVGQVVDAVWDHMPALRCWEAFAAILAAERNVDEDADPTQRRMTSSLKDKTPRDEESDTLDEDDLAVICEMLVASVREAGGCGDSHRAILVQRGERDSVDTPSLQFSRAFLPELPLLLVHFQADVRTLCALVQLPMHFQMECLEQEGQENHFKDILAKLVDLMSRHTGSPNLVKSCAETFKVLLSDKNPLKKLTHGTLQHGCSVAAKDLALQVRADLSTAEPLSVAAAILRVRVMSELTEPNASVRSSVVRLLQYQIEKGSMSDLTDDVTADAARSGCAVIAWWLAKIRARLEPAEGQSFGDGSLVQDGIKELQEHGALLVDLLGQICSSVAFPISIRMTCLQGLLTTLTLCRGVEKFCVSRGFSELPESSDIVDKNTRTDALDFLGCRPALDVLATAVRVCVLAIIEQVLELADHSLTGGSKNGKKVDTSLSETEVRDCFASLVQASFQSVLSSRISHLPFLGLLLKHKKPNTADPIPPEWTTVQLSRRYCQQRQLRESVRIQQELRALKDVGDMYHSDGLQLVKQLANSVVASREPGEPTQRAAKQLLDGLMQMVMDSHAEAMDTSKAVCVLTGAGFALVERVAVDDAAVLLTKLQPVIDLVDKESLVLSSSDTCSLFVTFRKCLESVAANETPEVPKLSKRNAKDPIRRGNRNPRRRKRASIESGAYHASSAVGVSSLRRSRRDKKKVDYARLSGMSEDRNDIDEGFSEESGTDNDESQVTGEDEDAEIPTTAADVARNMLKFSHSPRIPVAAAVAEPKQLPLRKDMRKDNGRQARPSKESATVHHNSAIHARAGPDRVQHERSNSCRDDDDGRDVSKQPRSSSPRPLMSTAIREGSGHGQVPEAASRKAVRTKARNSGFSSSSESNGKSDLPSPTAGQGSSGSASVHNIKSDGGVQPNGTTGIVSMGQGSENGQPLRRSPRTLKSPVSDGRIRRSSERTSSSPAQRRKPADRKLSLSSQGQKSSSTQTLKPPKLARAKRGRRNTDSANEDKENIEESREALKPVKHSSPPQPVVRRTKRRKRW